MALLFAEHEVVVYARVETPDASTKVVPVPTEAAGVALTVQIMPIRGRVVIDSQTGVELVNPHEMYVEPEDIESVPYGARVVWAAKSKQFRITKKADDFAGDGDVEDINHGVSEMELLEKAG